MFVSAIEPAAVPQPAAGRRGMPSRVTGLVIVAAGAATRWAGAHRKLVTVAGTLATLGGLHRWCRGFNVLEQGGRSHSQ